jgi:hypothetical protein
MSRSLEQELQLQQLIFSINPATGQPYTADMFQVADGQGTRRWQNVFDTISSQSARDGYSLGYLPSTIVAISNDTSSFSTIVATSYSTLSTQIGEGGIPGSITTYQLQSTVSWIQGPSKYISTADLVSSMTPFLDGTFSFMSNIQSTTTGLGSSGYVSSLSLQSTTRGIGLMGTSTMLGAGTLGYISSLSLQSTVTNLAQAGYVSTSALLSTVTGILYPITEPGGSLGVVVTGTTDAPYKNFSTLTSNYLSTNLYFNSTNAVSFGIVYGRNLPSTTTGLISSLGSYGYVSTATLLSTSRGIQEAKQNIFIDRSGSVAIYNSQVYLSTVGTITYLSSFVNSSIIYKGQNGDILGLQTGNSNLSFSTANLQLDNFSSYITSSSRVIAEIYPTFLFDTMTTGALTSKLFPMQTYVQYGTTLLSSVHETRVFGASAVDDFSNVFQQPIKIAIPGTDIIGRYAQPYVLYHTMSGALSYNLNVGFRESNLTLFFGSTNSVFMSVQNLSF